MKTPMRSIKLATSVLSALILIGGSLASVQSAPLLTGSVTEERVAKLTTDITWYTSLSAAEEAARSQNKLIFWVHMLGNLDGKT
jgi:hypothetical protein